MSKIEIETARLKDILESFQKVHTEMCFEFYDDEALVSTIDQSHTALMKSRLKKSLFLDYIPSECGKLIFDTVKLKKFLDVYPEDFTEVLFKENAIYVGKERNFLFYVFSEEEYPIFHDSREMYRSNVEKRNLSQALMELEVFSAFFKLELSEEDLGLSGEDRIRGQGRILLKVSKTNKRFKGVYLIQPLLDAIRDANVGENICFMILENNWLRFSFRKNEIEFEISIAPHDINDLL